MNSFRENLAPFNCSNKSLILDNEYLYFHPSSQVKLVLTKEKNWVGYNLFLNTLAIAILTL